MWSLQYSICSQLSLLHMLMTQSQLTQKHMLVLNSKTNGISIGLPTGARGRAISSRSRIYAAAGQEKKGQWRGARRRRRPWRRRQNRPIGPHLRSTQAASRSSGWSRTIRAHSSGAIFSGRWRGGEAAAAARTAAWALCPRLGRKERVGTGETKSGVEEWMRWVKPRRSLHLHVHTRSAATSPRRTEATRQRQSDAGRPPWSDSKAVWGRLATTIRFKTESVDSVSIRADWQLEFTSIYLPNDAEFWKILNTGNIYLHV